MAATAIHCSNLISHRSRRSAAAKPSIEFIPSASSVTLLFCALFVLCYVPGAQASELKPATNAAFDRYVAATEAQMDSQAGLAQFLLMDRLPLEQRRAAYDQLKQGLVFIQELRTKENGQSIPIPSGLVHHWAGVIFIPKATMADVLAVQNDYDHQADIYKPNVRQSKLISRSGDDAELFEQFYSKTIVTVVLNAYFHVEHRRLSSTRYESASRSTRIVELADPDNPAQGEQARGKDHGYMWRLNSYWRLEEKDGGIYVQNQSVSLSRTVPVLLAWLIEPLTKSIPREVLSRTLNDTRKAVEANAAKAKREEGPNPEGPSNSQDSR